MADHGNDVVDERAAAALEALRSGRPVDPAAPEVVATLRRWLERLGPVGVGGGLLVVAVVGALAWVALRPVGTPESEPALFSGSAPTVPVGTGAGELPPATTTTSTAVVVHAAGAVVAPGVYRLGPGLRVADLLAAAGGPTVDADVDRLNLAAPLADGQRLYVPRRGEVTPAAVAPDGGGSATGAPSSSDPGAGPSTAAPIDLNRADAEQLDALPGVGPATAAAIVEHRTRNGPFTTVDGLLDVRGIGPAKLEALRDLVIVG